MDWSDWSGRLTEEARWSRDACLLRIRLSFHIKYNRLLKCVACGARVEPTESQCPCSGELRYSPYSLPVDALDRLV